MCFTCECLLYDEHQVLLPHPSYPKCPRCKRFLAEGDQGCYHCFAIGNTIDECPECAGKPWSPAVVEATTRNLPRA